MCGISAPAASRADRVIYWKCPAGHEEADDAPLRERVFCLRCDHFYDQEDVRVRNGARNEEAAHA